MLAMGRITQNDDAPAPTQPVHVRVKPLVWRRADLSAWGEYADAGLLRYRMTWTYRDDHEVLFTMKCEHDGRVLYEGGDEEAAISAAQADYEARIMAALEPAPAGVTVQDSIYLREVETIREAVARGWCAPKNRTKQMDFDLAEAITQEVIRALSGDRT
jgi:hypothetical protein